jgi:lipopolysaccharide transport system permease protein
METHAVVNPATPEGVRGELVVIEPAGSFGALRLAELWAYRELLQFLIWRDVTIRYKQTVLGAAWAVLQPLAAAAVFTLFFGRIAGIASDGVPYAAFSFAGMVLWSFFAQGLSLASNSLVGSSHLITKVYFPRVMVPVASVTAGLLDLAIASAVLLVTVVLSGLGLSPRLLALPIPAALALITAVGTGLWLSALNVKYRDVRFVVPFAVQMWLFVTPVIYPASTVVPRLERLGLPGWLYGLNPMAGAVEAFRWATVGVDTHPWPLVATGVLAAFVLLLTGTVYFRSVERFFADVV